MSLISRAAKVGYNTAVVVERRERMCSRDVAGRASTPRPEGFDEASLFARQPQRAVAIEIAARTSRHGSFTSCRIA